MDRHMDRQHDKKENCIMARNFTIYDSRNRQTGTRCVTLDLRHADATPAVVKAAGGKRYAAMCVEHKSTVFFDEHYPAGRAIAHVDEWCKPCQVMISKGEKIAKAPAVSAPVVAAPAAIESAPSGKRTSNAKSNVATQRKAAASRKPSEVKATTPKSPRKSKATAAA
jgi:hypothetical protein